MGRGTGLAKLALGMGALRAANTAVRAAAWSSYPRYHSYYRPYGYYNYYDPYYYGGGYYGYSYGSSRGAGWFIAAFLVAIAGACCLLIPGIAGIICCGVGIAAALGLTIGGIVAANSAPNTVVVKEQSSQKQVEGNSPEKGQLQEKSQSQNIGNCAKKSTVVKYAKQQPKNEQMGIINNGSNFEVKSNKEQKQMAIFKKKTNKDNRNSIKINNEMARMNKNITKKQNKFIDIR